MDNSFKLSEYVDSLASDITNNMGLYNLLINPIYISVIITIIICIIVMITINNKQNIKSYIKIFFYSLIIILIVEMLRNSILKKYFINKYSEMPNNQLITDITSNGNLFMGGNNKIEPRKVNILDEDNDNNNIINNIIDK